MKDALLIKPDYTDRLFQVLDESWKIFKSQFANERNDINTEAPFQHHFAHILKNVGDLYSLYNDDLFKVDLEVKCDGVRGKTKYIDITCEYRNKIRCAIELKFKTKKQGAQDLGRIDAYLDLEALEIVVNEKKDFDFGKFYMITNSTPYIKECREGILSADFKTHDGHITKRDGSFSHNTKWATPYNVSVSLKNSYTFEWEKIKKAEEEWYFLELTIKRNT